MLNTTNTKQAQNPQKLSNANPWLSNLSNIEDPICISNNRFDLHLQENTCNLLVREAFNYHFKKLLDLLIIVTYPSSDAILRTTARRSSLQWKFISSKESILSTSLICILTSSVTKNFIHVECQGREYVVVSNNFFASR